MKTERYNPGSTEPCENTDVLIVGAGPAGLVLATKLWQSGLKPIIVEKLESGQTTSRAAVIHAHTLEVLGDELDVAECLGNHGIKLSGFSIRDRDHILLRLRFDQLPSRTPHLLMLPQDVTERLLNDALEKAGGMVRRGSTVTCLTTFDDGVIASVESAKGISQIRARYVVGADGMHSLVRKTAGIGFSGSDYSESFVLADVEMVPQPKVEEVMLFFSPEGLVVVAPLPNGSFRMVATMDDAPQHPEVADIQALLARRGPTNPIGKVSRVVWGSRFRVQHRLADQYRRGRLILVGDAAHVHSPAGGQGMNTGMVDACVLGRILADVVSGRKEERHLDLYETLRRPAAMEVLKLASGLTRMATVTGTRRRFLRNNVLRTLNRLPMFRQRMEMKLSGLSRRHAALVR